MQNITEPVLCFRDAAAHIWNCYLRTSSDPMSYEIQLSRDVIEFELLDAMVLSPCDINSKAENYRKECIMAILVSLKSGLIKIPALIGETAANGNVVWSKTILLKSNFPRLRFLRFFDWNPYGHVSMNLVQSFSIDEQMTYLIEDRFCDFLRTN